MELDVNFVDPPIQVGMTPYRPTIGPEDAGSELSRVADRVRGSEMISEAFGQEDTERIATGIEDTAAARVYAEGVPFIARFLTVELDTENEVSNGIGRVTPGDPPPRFGEKYRKRLKSSEARDRAGAVLEQLSLHGFATAAAANATAVEPADIVERPVPEWWTFFVRSLAHTYWGTEFDPTKGAVAMLTFGISHPALLSYGELVEDLKLGKGLNPVGRARAETYTKYFIALGWTLLFTRTTNVS